MAAASSATSIHNFTVKGAMEYAECEATVKDFPPFIEAMKKRGMDDMDLVMGRGGEEEQAARELLDGGDGRRRDRLCSLEALRPRLLEAPRPPPPMLLELSMAARPRNGIPPVTLLSNRTSQERNRARRARRWRPDEQGRNRACRARRWRPNSSAR
ncbi:hypothetical protein QYE76_018942 [Lolium multiflorum]|uniref:Uncharacterized protein n=1 Tax=Lolium multiflorum TaxID=4521 RepID=A0AAD8Q7B4_LOLMU|nr:hypothetical protein QYE76_018942 [Lolium multiflorum]